VKIALIRVHTKEQYDDGDFDEISLTNHITDFTEVTQEEYQALREFTFEWNHRAKRGDGQRLILVEDESEKLPKTIAEAMEFAIKKKAEWVATQKRLEQERRKRKQKAEERKTKKKDSEVAALAAKLEEYKAKIKDLKGEK
jgi:septin family protein